MADQGFQALEVTDFSGGMTDNYLDCPINAYQAADNLRIKYNKKLETRPGTVIYHATMYQIPAGATRVSSMFLFDLTDFFFYYNRAIYYQNVTWQTLTGPSSNSALAAGSSTSFLSYAEWNKHMIVTSDSFGSPMKIYKDASDVIRIRNAGLPKITLVSAMESANQIKSKYNAHAASAALHAHADATNQLTSPDATDFPSLIVLITEMLVDYVAHNADANLVAAWLYHGAQQAGAPANVLASTVTPETLTDCLTLLADIKTKFNAHDADATAHVSGSTQQVTKVLGPTIASAGGTTHSYIYYFVPYYEYSVGGVTYKDFGPTYSVTISNIGVPNSNTVTISNIPTLANGATQNWDTSVIKWYIYRTEDAGTTAYYLKNITNGTTSTTDTATDSSINTGTQIYTAGGILDNDPPPQAKFVVQANDIMWYLHCKEGNQVRKSRIRQSAKFDIDSCPESSYLDLEDEIVGAGAISIYPIAFCKKRIYRIEGYIDDEGRGFIDKKEISRTIGAVNNQSIVTTLDGIYFAGTDGFYFTDGYQVVRITPQFPETYAALVASATQKGRIYGKYSPKENRIFWCVSETASSSDNDQIFVLNLNFPPTPAAAFTTYSTNGSWAPCSIGIDASDNLVIGDSRGYVFKFDDATLTDPKVNVGGAPSTWLTSTILYDYRGPATNFGTINVQKLPEWITVTLENRSNVSLAINSKKDDSGAWTELPELRFRGNIIWGDSDAPSWGTQSGDYNWKIFPMFSEKRRFKSGNARCLYQQIQFTNSLTAIQNSDEYGTASIDKPNHTATLETMGSTWNSLAIDYYIAFENDGYLKNYLITARTSTIVTFSDSGLTAPTSGPGIKWVIRGYRRGERFPLLGYTINYGYGTSSFKPPRGLTGENA